MTQTLIGRRPADSKAAEIASGSFVRRIAGESRSQTTRELSRPGKPSSDWEMAIHSDNSLFTAPEPWHFKSLLAESSAFFKALVLQVVVS